MAITRLVDHDDHTVRIHMTKAQGPHYAALRCVQCRKHIQWLNRQDCQFLLDLGVEQHNEENFYEQKTARL
jgi:hypothetical protein